MGEETTGGGLEERLKSFCGQLQAERGVFERIVYKNKNQHRRCSYFQHLLKVRRDLRLLHSTKLEELLTSCFHVITARKPKQKIHLLESLKWRKSDCGTPNFMERLLGAARLLSQMAEPMLKAATDISTLLARSFFMGFSLTIMALIARLRVLVQQILVDVVSVFNTVSSLSQKKQSVKITQEGIEVFREYYPTNKKFVFLECVWETDKFVLLERPQRVELKSQDGDTGDASAAAALVLRYKSLESFLGDDETDIDKVDGDSITKESSSQFKEDEKDAFTGRHSIATEHEKQAEDKLGNNPPNAGTPDQQIITAASSSSPSTKPSTEKSNAKEVAFLSVKRPASSTTAFVSVKRPAISAPDDVKDLHPDETTENSSNKDSLFNLLADGNLKDGLL